MTNTLIKSVFQPQVLEGRRYWASWEKKVRKADKDLTVETGETSGREVEVDFSKFTPDRYLLSQATIVGGVEPEKDGHTIRLPHCKWINDNSNAWLNQVLLESYKSFILAFNYLEHIQIKELSKGFILDAVAWVLREYESGKKEEIPSVFIDILVATDKKKHPTLVQKILSGALGTLSMGTNITHSQCSRCGEIFEEGEDQCDHLTENMGKKYTYKDGTRRVIAELCGVPGIKDSNMFLEASWVGTPAWAPAKRHMTVTKSDHWIGKPLKAFVPKSRARDAKKE